MKTPDEIKKGLECCVQGNVCRDKCPYGGSPHGIVECTTKLSRDVLAYIQQLERERDAAVEHMRDSSNCCDYCKHNKWGCTSHAKADHSCFEWRGVKEE